MSGRLCVCSLAVVAVFTVAGCHPLPTSSSRGYRPEDPPSGQQSSEAEAPKPPQAYFDRFYLPDTPEEVAAARYAILLRDGFFDRLIKGPSLRGAPNPTWQSVGPFGIRGLCPGASTRYISGRIISFEQGINDSSILYVGAASGGVWRSTDGGVSWSNVFDNLPHPSVGAIVAYPLTGRPGAVWIGTGNKGNGVSGPGAPSLGLVYRSENNGNTWIPVSFETSESVGWVSKIVFIPQSANQDVVFIATDRGIYKSINYGGDWTKVLAGRYSDLAYFAPIFGSSFELVAAEHFGNKLYKSTSGGGVGTWSPITLPGASASLGRITLAYSRFSAHQALYANVAATDGTWEGIWRSPDFGDSWVKVTTPNTAFQMNYNNTIAVDLTNEDRVYTGANWREIYYSTNGGASWTFSSVNPDGVIHEDQHAMFAQGSTVIVANDGGIWKSTNFGQTFSDFGNRFIDIAQIYYLTVNDDASGLFDGTRYYIGTQDNGVQRGPREFLDWEGLTCCDGGDIAFRSGIPYSTITGLSSTSTHRYQYPPGGTICTAWTGFSTGLPSGQPWTNRLLYNNADFYTNFGTGLYRAAGGVLPWTLRRSFSTNILTFGAAPEGFVVAGLNATDQVWYSNASQSTWSRTSNSTAFWEGKVVTGVDFGDLSGVGRRVYLTLSGVSGKRIVLSDNSGRTFVDITGDLPEQVNARTLMVRPGRESEIYIGSDLGVWVTTNRGSHWRPFSNGLPAAAYVNDIEYDTVHDRVVLATYGRGVYLNDPFPDLLFFDGFESGSTSDWSNAVP